MADHPDNRDALTSAISEYLTRSFDSDRRLALLDKGGLDVQFQAELAELGWFGLAVPERHDGLGFPLCALGPVFTTFGRHLVPGPMLESLLLPAVLLNGSDHAALTARLQRTVAEGAVLALADPGITDDWLSDVGGITLTDDGLQGSVALARFAAQAHSFVVIARRGDEQAVCVVDAADPGVVVEEIDSADPTAPYGRVAFHGAHRDTAPLAVGTEANTLVSDIRSWARLLIACELTGIAERLLDRSVEYVQQRQQFGAAIGTFQAVKHTVANMYERTSSLRNLCNAAMADAPASTEHDLAHTAAVAKAYAADAALRVCEDALQMHGGIGFTTEVELHWYYKRALALRAWYGDEIELHRAIGATTLAAPE